MRKNLSFMAAAFLAFCTTLAHADISQHLSSTATTAQHVSNTATKSHPETGRISIASGVAELNIGPGFIYLNPADTETMLVKYGNPPSPISDTLGAILPTNGENWFAVLGYSDSGHVSDSDAASVNYDDLLKTMQEQTATEAADRKAKGLNSAQLVGWAQTPFYDSVHKKLHWAVSLKFEQADHLTLNYRLRALGRAGYVTLNIVSDISDLPAINAEMPRILAMVNFTPTNTYADYVAGTDHLAEIGIAGLVAGGVLAKAGIFKGLLAFADRILEVDRPRRDGLLRCDQKTRRKAFRIRRRLANSVLRGSLSLAPQHDES